MKERQGIRGQSETVGLQMVCSIICTRSLLPSMGWWHPLGTPRTCCTVTWDTCKQI